MTARLVAMLAVVAGCNEPGGAADPGGRSDDLAAFAERAQPTLARSCAFPACHGVRDRGLALFAIGRSREIEDPTTQELQFSPLSSSELMTNLESTLRFVDPGDPASSELLLRALPISDGQRGHGGGVLFPARDDPGYLALLGWIQDEVQP